MGIFPQIAPNPSLAHTSSPEERYQPLKPLSAGIAGRRAHRLHRARAARVFRDRTTRFDHTEAQARQHVERFHRGVLRRRRRDARGSGSREGGRPRTRELTRDRPRRRRRSHDAQVPRRPRVSRGG